MSSGATGSRPREDSERIQRLLGNDAMAARSSGGRPSRLVQSWAHPPPQLEQSFAPRLTNSFHGSTSHDLNSSRTFGGISAAVKLNRTSDPQVRELIRFWRSFESLELQRPYVIAFVNSRSGGQIGQAIMEELRRLLGVAPDMPGGEVCDLSETDEPTLTIQRIARSDNQIGKTRFLVCGGDGTVTWILNEIARCPELVGKEPPLGICPLGTGNDLARSLGWGPVLKRVSDLADYLKWATAAEPVILDQWQVMLKPHGELPEEHKLRSPGSHPQSETLEDGREVFVGYFQNYFSMGMDAKVTGVVESSRKDSAAGKKCFQWGCGKLCYCVQGVLHSGFLKMCCAPVLTNSITDLKYQEPGKDRLLDLDLPHERIHGRAGRLRQISIANINCYGGGQNVFEDSRVKPNDGAFEILALRNPCIGISIFCHLARMHLLGWADLLEMTLNDGEYMQMDGEPWYMPCPCDVHIQRHRQVRVLRAPQDALHWKGHVTPEFWRAFTESELREVQNGSTSSEALSQ